MENECYKQDRKIGKKQIHDEWCYGSDWLDFEHGVSECKTDNTELIAKM